MTGARGTGDRQLPALLVLCLVAALTFLMPANTPAPSQVAGLSDLAATDAPLPCHGNGNGDGAAGDYDGGCGSTEHHCPACFVAVAVPEAGKAAVIRYGTTRRLRPASGRALTRPAVPHGPPRLA